MSRASEAPLALAPPDMVCVKSALLEVVDQQLKQDEDRSEDPSSKRLPGRRQTLMADEEVREQSRNLSPKT